MPMRSKIISRFFLAIAMITLLAGSVLSYSKKHLLSDDTKNIDEDVETRGYLHTDCC